MATKYNLTDMDLADFFALFAPLTPLAHYAATPALIEEMCKKRYAFADAMIKIKREREKTN
jgi:hypothetical protein